MLVFARFIGADWEFWTPLGFRSQTLTPDVHFVLIGVDHRADVTPKNCQALLSATCPIDADQTITYRARLTVDPDLIPVYKIIRFVAKVWDSRADLSLNNYFF